jgi:hypothetical protein
VKMGYNVGFCNICFLFSNRLENNYKEGDISHCRMLKYFRTQFSQLAEMALYKG